jgi:DNA repair exonuclease SbcCD nuclease subunit
MAVMRVLFLSDTHLGLDLPLRPRVERRRRGPDFFANLDRALAPALRGEADCVVHGGDLFNRSNVPAALVLKAFEPLKRAAGSGVPVFIVPGNHERSQIPRGLFAVHPNLHIFDCPRTFVLQLEKGTLALSGFPYEERGVRSRFHDLVEKTKWREEKAGARLLCIHQCVEGATVGPANYTFRQAEDVVRIHEIPADFCAALAGHIHRHQVLRRDLAGRPAPVPVFYAGAIERCSFAEKDEPKGYLTLDIACEGGPGKALQSWQFHELPARPMVQYMFDETRDDTNHVKEWISTCIRCSPNDGIVRLRLPVRLLEGVSAAWLRSVTAATMNVEIAPLPSGAT